MLEPLGHFTSMIAAADEGAAGHFGESHPAGLFAEVGKLGRWNVAVHRQMRKGGLQVLAHGEEIATGVQ